MISRFFIDRPIFASVLSIVITLAGGIALFSLPVAQYPLVAPPTVQVDCTYPGASAQVVAESVATPIEQQVNGVENMLYMSSQCTNDGAYNLTVTFKQGVDLNVAQVLVQNRVSLALPLLPDVIKQTGVNTRKKSPDMLMSIAVNSPGGLYDQFYLSNYVLVRMKEEIARVPGVSDITMQGQRDYSMRIWVDPDMLAARSLTAGDVVKSIQEQNMSVSTGQIGQAPAAPGQVLQIPLSTLGRLITVEQFSDIIIKSTEDGRVTRLKDVARVELGPKNQDINCQVNGKPSVSMTIWLLPDANALDTGDLVRAKLAELEADFPKGVAYEIRYDTTPFIRESIQGVYRTLEEAILLVSVVVLLFLQNWRSAIIPLVAVPVAIVGTFAVMLAFGFSLNNLTLFGLVLAIGIVVDDAIVVVEAVEHHIDHGLSPRAATMRAMDEVSGPVIAIGLVLSAVFVPCAFISGIIGQFFRQFALTIATSTLISAFNSLTLSPALAAMLLKPRSQTKRAVLPRPFFAIVGGFLGYEFLQSILIKQHLVPRVAPYASVLIGVAAAVIIAGLINWLLSAFFGLFNRAFNFSTKVYTRTVGLLLYVSPLVLLVYGGLVYVTYWEFKETPKGFIPSQDMGYAMGNVQLPDAASAERTWETLKKLEKIAHNTPGVRHTQIQSGQSMLLSASGSNFGSMIINFAPFDERPNPVINRFFDWLKQPKLEARVRGWLKMPRKPSLNSEVIVAELRKRFAAGAPEAISTVLGPAPVRGVGRAGGFKLMVEDRGELGSKMLQEQTENLAQVASRSTALVGLASVFRASVPQLYVDVNRVECLRKEVAIADLFDAMRVFLGSRYVNDFNWLGRTWQVIVQADSKFRNRPEEIHRLRVRNARGQMVPLGSVVNIKEQTGPLVLTRYNMHPAAPLNGSAAPGISSGTAIDIMEQLALLELPESMSIEWTELAYLERQAGNTAMLVFGFAVVMVFLVLAAQYESWALPLAIIMVVPMCLLGALTGVMVSGSEINIFTQVGFVVLVGLASKNAILIVEFAKVKREQGATRRQATLEACRLRLRPIVMTSMAFILGVVPLLLSDGAGAEMRRTLGLTVFSGMLGVTLFGVFLTPVFFFIIDWLGESKVFASKWSRLIFGIPLELISLRSLRHLGQRSGRFLKIKPAVGTPKLPDQSRPAAELEEEAAVLVEQK